MITSAPTEMEFYQHFLGQQRLQGNAFVSVDESVIAFRKYQQEIAKVRELCQPALEECDRGEYADFNFEEVKARVLSRLDAKGIRE
jgi:hypothetical protein